MAGQRGALSGLPGMAQLKARASAGTLDQRHREVAVEVRREAEKALDLIRAFCPRVAEEGWNRGQWSISCNQAGAVQELASLLDDIGARLAAGDLRRELKTSREVLQHAVEMWKGNPRYELRSAAAGRAHPIRAAHDVLVRIAAQPTRPRVLLFHGRDEAFVQGLRGFLQAVGLEAPTFEDWVKEVGMGSPQNLEVVFKATREASAILIVCTPDETVELAARLRDGSDSDAARMQPRPNVIFEAGIALALRSAQFVIFVEAEPDLSGWTDIDGLNKVRFRDDADSRKRLASRLETVGLAIQRDADGGWLRAGDFGGAQASGFVDQVLRLNDDARIDPDHRPDWYYDPNQTD
jgi:predicted nucleotide-binding protein